MGALAWRRRRGRGGLGGVEVVDADGVERPRSEVGGDLRIDRTVAQSTYMTFSTAADCRSRA
jgi:hypothetical protein